MGPERFPCEARIYAESRSGRLAEDSSFGTQIGEDVKPLILSPDRHDESGAG